MVPLGACAQQVGYGKTWLARSSSVTVAQTVRDQPDGYTIVCVLGFLRTKFLWMSIACLRGLTLFG